MRSPGGSPSGGLGLDGAASSTWTNVTTGRVDSGTPANSSILLKPLHTNAGGSAHGGGNFFTDTNDADYRKILQWITEGAKNN